MDVHRMKCFLRLAEELHFSRAAEKECMAQSTMSQQIHNLEDELDARLFIRNNRSVHLTPAGEYLKREFSRLLENYEAAKHEVRRIAGQEKNMLSIGYHGPFYWMFFQSIFQKFKSTYPEIVLSLTMENWGDIPAKLMSEEIDLGFLEGAEVEESTQIESFYLYRDYTCFALHKSHPLARKQILREEDIKDEHIVMVDTSIGRKSMELCHQRLIQSGIDIRKGTLMKKFESCMAMASTGVAIVPMPRSFKQENQNEIVYIDYDSTETYVDIHMAWMKENKNSTIATFIDYIKKCV
ncbi:LysR family transcriptional regulator [Marispirochaeta aestuarii]|uniref:LysR family transcriptional regulator n=1 Tax=Marispirochaeta aestuarii TaxID=1963862 RepID=UPI0029C6E2A6|nr:LysR family transcriptional regulator [Marispirochaeta aestuarii]